MRKLQEFSFKKSRYQRPTLRYICGRSAEGRPCPLGPNPSGGCRATGECLPLKKGDHWVCTRPDSAGGPCAEGALPDGKCSHPIPPCQPIRSVRSRRGLVGLMTFWLAVGSLLLIFGSRGGTKFITPGELTYQHSAAGSNCGDCHSVAHKAPLDSVHAVFTRKMAVEDSGLCLKCHDLGGHSLSPHGLATNTLSSLRDGIKPPGFSSIPVSVALSSMLSKVPGSSSEQIACATCHREHHGKDFNLAKLDNQQCQSCHTVKFSSLADGHPEFGSYPHKPSPRIAFDHHSHIEQHFRSPDSKSLAPASCTDCHQVDNAGGKMMVKSFEQICAACHNAEIVGERRSGPKGIAFLSIPGLDKKTLSSRGIDVGEWPEDADTAVTPFMKLLLCNDAGASGTLEQLAAVDLQNLSAATPEQLKAAGAFAWRVKALFFDLVTNGQSALLARLGSSEDKVPPTALAQLPFDTIHSAQIKWLPNLLKEIPIHDAGGKLPAAEKPIPPPVAAPSPTAVPKAGSDGGDILGAAGNDTAPAATPKPAEDRPGVPAQPAASAPPKQDDILGAAPAAAPTPGGMPKKEDDILGAPAAPAPAASPASPPVPAGDILSGPSAAPAAASPTPSAPAAAASSVSPEAWMGQGGWYLSEDYSVRYRPAGHADPFLRGWFDLATRVSGKSPIHESAFKEISSPQNPGACMKCHRVTTDSGTPKVNWLVAQPSRETHEFTRFSHAPHFSLLNQTGCLTCHTMSPTSVEQTIPRDHGEPMIVRSDFSSINKNVCASCHTAKAAGDSCQICHGYHVGKFTSTVLRSATLLSRQGK